MKIPSVSVPALLVSASAFLTGCLDMAQNPEPGDKSKLAMAAFSGSLIDLCSGCGSRPAFPTAVDPTKPFGWALDETRLVPGGHPINRIYYNYSKSQIAVTTRTGGLVDLDVRGNNELWGVNSDGAVFRNTYPSDDNSPWANVPTDNLHPNFAAIKIGAGLNNVFVLVRDTVAGGNQLYKWTGGMTGFPWQLVYGGLVDIDVDNNDDLWGVNNEGKVFRLPGGNPSANWELRGGAGTGVAIACGNGKIYVVDQFGDILQLINGSWTLQSTGGYKDIQVDVAGRLWAGTTSNHINTWPGI
jgi:hypothetical protein